MKVRLFIKSEIKNLKNLKKIQMESAPQYKSLLFIFALEKEALPFLSLLSIPLDPLQSNNLVISAYTVTYKSLKISVIHPKVDPKFNCDSIGPENSAVATYIGINSYKPDLIISAGNAGAFQKVENKEIEFKLGDVCYSKEPIGFIDREIILDEFKDYMVGKYDIVQLKQIFSDLGFKEAVIGTTSSFHDFCAGYSMKKGIDLQDMEAAAIQKIAFYMRIPFLAIKIVVSLNYGKDVPEEITKRFFEHVGEKSDILAGELKKMIDLMAI